MLSVACRDDFLNLTTQSYTQGGFIFRWIYIPGDIYSYHTYSQREREIFTTRELSEKSSGSDDQGVRVHNTRMSHKFLLCIIKYALWRSFQGYNGGPSLYYALSHVSNFRGIPYTIIRDYIGPYSEKSSTWS